LVDRLFVRLNSIYGHLWSSRFPDANMLAAAKAEWGMDLAKCTPEQLGRALEACKQQYDTPPSLPQFSRLCGLSTPPSHKPFPKELPKPRMPKEQAMQKLEEIRRAARGGLS
jgi:hypothetical protein